MFNVCPGCGMYSVEKTVRALADRRAEAICPECGFAQPFLRQPLYLVSGASGAGKSALALRLSALDASLIHLESDILWGRVNAGPEDDYRSYRDLWLRLAKNIGQAGRPVALYGSAIPLQFEDCPERRYFGPLHMLALVCDPAVLATRLRARPDWRASSGQAFIEDMLEFNQWFIDQGPRQDPPITLLDTSTASLDQSAAAVRAWIRGLEGSYGPHDRKNHD